METTNKDRFKIIPNSYVEIDKAVQIITDEENQRYKTEFERNFAKGKAKRAFQLGIVKYIEKVMRKKRFIPL